MQSVSYLLIKALRDIGIRRVFGIPGGACVPYMEMIRKQGGEFILVSNEASAGFMATVCGRLTGIPGACYGTFGPGATNLSTGVGCAYLDRSPVIALTSELRHEMTGRVSQMNIDHQKLFQPISKWTTRLESGKVVESVYRAATLAMSEVPGPIHIGIPEDIAGVETSAAKNETFSGPVPISPPHQESLEGVLDLIRRARRPLLAVGYTAARLKLHRLLAEAVVKHNLPVVLTPMAKGMLPENHPCYVGVLFHGMSEFIAPVYSQADAVVGVGYDPVEFNYEEWMPDVPLVHMNTAALDKGTGVHVLHDVVGDLQRSLLFLHEADPVKNDWNFEYIRRKKQEMFSSLRPKEGGFKPSDALTILREMLPLEGIMTCDVGAHTHLIGQLWPTPEPGLQIMTNGWSSMGFGVPAAIAAKLCYPEKIVVCVSGDGGFSMTAGEIVTARRLRLKVVFMVLVDKNLSLISAKQEFKGYERYSTKLFEGDFFCADRFFGVPVLRAGTGRELQEALKSALFSDEPIIVEVFVDGAEYRQIIAKRYR